jgi:hypothetical protein
MACSGSGMLVYVSRHTLECCASLYCVRYFLDFCLAFGGTHCRVCLVSDSPPGTGKDWKDLVRFISDCEWPYACF